LNNTRQTSLTNRFFSSSNLNYKITNWLDATYRLGFDTYTEDQSYWINKGGVGYSAALLPGALRTTSANNTVLDHSFILSVNKELSADLDLTGMVGYNYRSNDFKQQGLESLGQVVYGLLEHRNYTGTQPRDFRGYNLNYVEKCHSRCVL
jgi:hypothetical protein